MKTFCRALMILFSIGSIHAGASFAEPGWFWQNPRPQAGGLIGVAVVDPQTTFAVGALGSIVRTRDGGNTWTHQSSGTSDTLTAVTFMDANAGWAIGGEFGAVILHTTNAGETWTQQFDGPRDLRLRGVSFVDAQTGWAVGWAGIILHTNDGARSMASTS